MGNTMKKRTPIPLILLGLCAFAPAALLGDPANLRNPPSLDALRDAYRLRNESCEAMIRLGSMLEDIEAAHGVGYKFEKFDDSGTADSFFIDYDTPWQTGIRGFLKDAPDLLAAYKTLMRYKKLSADFRKAIGLQDPNPASLVFDGTDEVGLVPIRGRAHKLLDEALAKPLLFDLQPTISQHVPVKFPRNWVPSTFI